jgi:hypothetical protein
MSMVKDDYKFKMIGKRSVMKCMLPLFQTTHYLPTLPKSQSIINTAFSEVSLMDSTCKVSHLTK